MSVQNLGQRFSDVGFLKVGYHRFPYLNDLMTWMMDGAPGQWVGFCRRPGLSRCPVLRPPQQLRVPQRPIEGLDWSLPIFDLPGGSGDIWRYLEISGGNSDQLVSILQSGLGLGLDGLWIAETDSKWLEAAALGSSCASP